MSHQEGLRRLFGAHPRSWRQNHYVYPVLSRRSKGLSIGVNLNPDKICNFDCIYCQVDRTVPAARSKVELNQLERELEPFDTGQLPVAFRRLDGDHDARGAETRRKAPDVKILLAIAQLELAAHNFDHRQGT